MATKEFKEGITSRFNEIVSYFKENGIAETNTEIGKLIGQPLQQVSKLISGERIITLEQTKELSKNSNINIEWLLTGEGSMVVSEKMSIERINKIKVNDPLEYFQTKNGSQYEELPGGKYRLTVPLVPVRAQARYVTDFQDAEFISELVEVSFIVDRVGKGNYMAFEVQNDSMDDDSKRAIPDGAIVLGRELGRQHWKSKFRINDFPYWIIVHKSTILCKEIIGHDVERGIITCHSLNDSPEYQDFTVKLDDVKQLFNIISKQFI